jgi:hypothetical protein
MDEQERPQEGPEGAARTKRPRGRRFAAASMLATGLVAGGILAGSHVAGAATNSSAGSASATASTSQAAPSGMDPAKVAHGPGETLLTGTTASKVKAAAQAAVPGATIIRVESDSEGSAYEAHMQKADGSFVTVKLDKSFNVTDTISGFGAGAPPSSSTGA